MQEKKTIIAKSREGGSTVPAVNEVSVLEQLKIRREQEILADFLPTEQAIIREKQKRLSVLAQFIGKDFKMPVELNESGGGWHWDFKNNIVRIDPRDLLEKPFDYLRFVISHEGGHRRISRTDFIPEEVWSQPGFSFMMNAVEDPRDNNFVADSYSQFAEQMDLAYQEDLDLEEKASAKAKKIMGRQPRFMRAGFELIKQWYKEVKNEPEAISEYLPDEVRQAVAEVLSAARDSWWTYPLKNDSEVEIRRYAKASYKINLEKIWPEFSKLVEFDLEDQKTQELLDELKKQKGERPDQEPGDDNGGLPQELKNQLTPEEQEQLEQVLDEAMDSAEGSDEIGDDKQSGEESPESGKPSGRAGQRVDMDKLPEGLKQKIKEYLQSLPEEKKKELQEKARQSLKDVEAEAGEAIRGKFESAQEQAEQESQGRVEESEAEPEPSLESPEEKDDKAEKEDREKKEGGKKGKKKEKDGSDKKSEADPEEERTRKEALSKMREQIEKVLEADSGIYEKTRHELLPLIKLLEDELRQVFTERAKNKSLTGFKSGRKIDIVKRIQEKAKGVLTMDSKAWQRREAPGPRDYAFTLLVDLSGSMRSSSKIEETFKATIVLAEVLNRLGIKTEILGFNDRLHQYQAFGQYFDGDCRAKIGTMIKEVDSSRARYNDDGWAVLTAAQRLAQEREQEKFLLVFSDGAPEESPAHSGREFNLSSVVKSLEQEKKVKLVGLGIGRDTKHVNDFYPNSLANIPVEHLAENLAGVIKEAVANYDHFR